MYVDNVLTFTAHDKINSREMGPDYKFYLLGSNHSSVWFSSVIYDILSRGVSFSERLL